MTGEADVAVVGAGLAGLVAAARLVAAGRDVVVLEARDRVGGRLHNQDIGEGAIVEMGGQWVGPTQDAVAALVAELGLQTFPTFGDGLYSLEWRGRIRRHRTLIPRISPAVLADFAQAQARLDAMARRVPAAAPWTAPRAGRWDGRTFEDWIRANTVTRGARTMLRIATEAVWAAEPKDLSLLHLLFYVSSAGGWDRLLGTQGGAQQDRIVGGTQLLALRLEQRLGDVVRLESPVSRIEHGAAGVTVRAAGGDVRARAAIVAVPAPLAARLDFDPPLPAARAQLLQRMPAGSVIKCHAIYDEPFWRRDGLNGQGTSDAGPARVFFDNSPPGGSPGVLLAFLEGDAARRLGPLPAHERREQVLGVLARVFGERARRPEAFHERDWAAEEWTRGCYGAFLGPGTWTAYGAAMRPPVGPVHWAGAELADRWSGYMDGAVRSGQAAAAAVLAAP